MTQPKENRKEREKLCEKMQKSSSSMALLHDRLAQTGFTPYTLKSKYVLKACKYPLRLDNLINGDKF